MANTDFEKTLARALKGDERAISHLYKDHYALLTYWAASFTQDKDQAHDLLQNVFLKLLERKRTGFGLIQSPGAFLRRFLQISWFEMFRKEERHMAKEKRLPTEPKIDLAPEDIFIAWLPFAVGEYVANVKNDMHKSVLQLLWIKFYTVNDVAAELSMSINTIYAVRRTHRELLKAYMKHTYHVEI